MKCIRRKKQYLKARVGQPHEASFSDIIRPFEYIQMDFTGRLITEGGRGVYGLVCVCLQTYNTKIYGIESRKLESISLALEEFIQEVDHHHLLHVIKKEPFARWQMHYIKKGLKN